MTEPGFDSQERRQLCDLLDELGPAAATLIEGWDARDLAAHLVLREHDLVAAPCLVLPGPFARFAERRRARLAERREFAGLVDRIRAGPPPGFFRVGWVRSFPNLNEYFVHHEDLRRANGMGPRTLDPALEAALWRNVRRGARFLSRRLRDTGLEVAWSGTDERVQVRSATRPYNSAGRRVSCCCISSAGDALRMSTWSEHPRPWPRSSTRTSGCERRRRSGRQHDLVG